jgi:hypothetical protein
MAIVESRFNQAFYISIASVAAELIAAVTEETEIHPIPILTAHIHKPVISPMHAPSTRDADASASGIQNFLLGPVVIYCRPAPGTSFSDY